MSGPGGTTPVINFAALVPHEPVGPTPAELAELGATRDQLIAEAEVY
ncbi:hypothetical protein BX257_8508 [Streptomyces sp. 3212.3]|nr:hypothetical protein BX257_8508 [Streptomyces sp. 3212.3]